MNFLDNSLTNLIFLDNYLWEWILSIILTLVIYLILVFGKKYAENKLKLFAEKTANNFDDYLLEMLSCTSKIFIFISAINIGANIIHLANEINTILYQIFVLILFWQITKWVVLISNIVFTRYKKKFGFL